MEQIEIPPFYVGQEVMANCDHHQRAFKKGDEFLIESMYKCVCGTWMVTVGIQNKYIIISRCIKCDLRFNTGADWPFLASRFSPKIQLSEFISMKQLADQQLEIIGAN